MLSKQRKEICNRIYDENAISIFDHFAEKLNFKLAFERLIFLIVVCSIFTSVGTSFFIGVRVDKLPQKKNKDS